MTQFSYTIKDAAGIHARPAGMFVKAMAAFESDISLTCGAKSANCKRLFGIMGMAVKCGETVQISASGPDEEKAIETAKAFFEENL